MATTFELKEVKGDLFDSQDSLAHCVSADFHMGKGIALTFRTKFGRLSELHEQKTKVPGVAFLKEGDEKTSRFLYYLVTKEKYYGKPTYETLEASLKALLEHASKNGVKKLSIPRIGCGLDRLLWDRVYEMLQSVFENSGMVITVYAP